MYLAKIHVTLKPSVLDPQVLSDLTFSPFQML